MITYILTVIVFHLFWGLVLWDMLWFLNVSDWNFMLRLIYILLFWALPFIISMVIRDTYKETKNDQQN